MWTVAYWKTVAERVVGGAIAGIVTVAGGDFSIRGLIEADPKSLAVAAGYGALAGLIVSVGSTFLGPDRRVPLVTAQPVPSAPPADPGGHVHVVGPLPPPPSPPAL